MNSLFEIAAILSKVVVALLLPLAWLAVSFLIAWWVARRARFAWAKASIFVLAAAVLLLGPFSDEVIGGAQFKRYCGAADNVNFSGTIQVVPDFYTPDGEWRLAYLGVDADKHRKLVRLADSLVRWDHGTEVRLPTLVPIWQRQTRIYDAQTNRLVADWVSYSYRGGWLSRIALPERRNECRPKMIGEGGYRMYQQVFTYNK
jgi:hypothetical protein